MEQTEVLKQELAKKQMISLPSLIEKSVKELGRALPAHLNADRLVRIALTCLRINPELMKCTPESFLGSLFLSAQMGIEPMAGRSYLLPFNNKRKINGEWKTIKECQFLLGYRGLIELFYRHEAALAIDMQTVYTNDVFDYAYGTNSFINHKPALKERGEVMGFYAIAKLKGGASIFRFMSLEDAMGHGKKHSKTFNKNDNKFSDYSPWSTEPEAMCKKTVLIQLCKVLPLSVEIQRIIGVDETSREIKSDVQDVFELPDTTNWEETVEA